MPGLPKRQSYELLHQMYGHHESGVAGLPPPPKPSTPNTMAQSIKYIPPQTDPMASLSTRADRENPIRLFVEDLSVLFVNLRYLPNVLLPFKAKSSTDELYFDLSGIKDGVLQGGLFVLESHLFLLAIPAILVLPGALWIGLLAMGCLLVYLLCKPIDGPAVLYSTMSEETLTLAEQHKDERWLFVNGIIVGRSGLQKNIDRIATTFGRAVIGIHNQTWGFPADLLECIIQRVFAYRTLDVRIAHSYVKATLVDPTVTKVVLIGHSQGGIIVSLVIDQLLTELPAESMSKLEVYTFGSAASHFSNPPVSLPLKASASNLPLSPMNGHSDKPTQPKHIIPYIEHYANEQDLVPRWGVLHCTQDVLNNRYAGSVFVRMGGSGHMFNQHYMDPMFPLPEKDTHWLQDNYLDKVIQVDEKLAIRRESTAISNAGHMGTRSGLEFGNGETLPELQLSPDGSTAGPIGNGETVTTFARTDSGRLLAAEARGKTVRELSRLWRYQGGRSPHTSTPVLTVGTEVGLEHQWPLSQRADSPGNLARHHTALRGESKP